MANKQRGEFKAVLKTLDGGSVTYTLRPSFENICNLEDFLDDGVFTIGQRMMTGKTRMRDVAAIVAILMVVPPGGKRPSIDEVGEMVMKTGVIHMGDTLSSFIKFVFNMDEKKEDGDKDEVSDPNA